jgi:hypothetical protein
METGTHKFMKSKQFSEGLRQSEVDNENRRLLKKIEKQ